MGPQDLVRAIAYLTACERYSVAESAAADLPDWLDIIDVLRAVDGVEQLARALDAHRRQTAA